MKMSSNDTSGDLTLVDINTGAKFILCHTQSMYQCGRKRTNQILTNSILASREHCIFLRVRGELHVIDQGSANGIYINGVFQEPKHMVKLKIDDIIGLGSPMTVPDPNRSPTTPTIYILKANEPDPEQCSADAANSEPIDDVATKTSESKKRSSNDCDDPKVPCKIPKVENEIQVPIGKNETSEIRAASSSVSGKKYKEAKFQSQLPDIIDITDDNSSDYEMKAVISSESRNTEKDEKIVEKPIVSPCLVDDPGDENDISRSLLMDDDEMNGRCDVSSTTNSSFENGKSTKREKNVAVSMAKNIFDASSSVRKNQVQSSSTAQKTTSDENVLPRRRKRKSNRDEAQSISGVDSSREAKKATIVDKISKDNDRIVPRQAKTEESSSSNDEDSVTRTKAPEECDESKVKEESDDDFGDFLIPPLNLDDLNLHDRMQYDEEKIPSGDANPSSFMQSNDNGVVQWIKYEPEITIIDEDESVYENAKRPPVEVPAPTPLKLKHIKQETKTRYSEIDIVTLSEDDEDFYPASQLFGDEPEDKVKTEPLANEMEESDGEIFKNEDTDALDIIIMDSENEDDPLYNRVMQSSLNESRELYIKREPEEQRPVTENRRADELALPSERDEIYKLCFSDDIADAGETTPAVGKEKKKTRSKSVEKLESTRLELLEELDELERSLEGTERPEKRDGEAKKIAAREGLDANEERKSTESKLRKENFSGKEKSTMMSKESEHARSEKRDRKAKEKKRDKKRSSLGSISTEISSDAINDTDSENGKNNGRIAEKPSKVYAKKSEDSTEKPMSSETSRSRKQSKSPRREKSRSISADKPDEVLPDNRKSVPNDKSRSTSTEKSRSTRGERSRSISIERPGSSSGEKRRSFSKEDAQSTTSGEKSLAGSARADNARKSVQIVEAPFLAKGEGRGVSCDVKRVDKSAERDDSSNNSFLGSWPKINDITPTKDRVTGVSPKKSGADEHVGRLTTKQRKALELKAKHEKYLKMKEQKLRRMKNKWAECLPPRPHQGPSLSRKEREEIKNDRKEKLKKIADENKKMAENNEATGSKRPTTKAIVKITEKTRNDYLVNDMEDRIGNQSADSERTNVASDARPSGKNEKHRDRSSEISKHLRNNDDTLRLSSANSSNEGRFGQKSTDVVSGKIARDETSKQSNKETKKRDESLGLENVNPANGQTSLSDRVSSVNKVSHRLRSLLVIEPRSHEPQGTREKLNHKIKKKSSGEPMSVASNDSDAAKRSAANFLTTAISKSSKSRDPRIEARQAAGSSIKTHSSEVTPTDAQQPKVIKRVSFNDLMTKIQFFEIQPGNTMKKCPSTDAPIQTKVQPKKRTLDRAACPKLEQFLLRIFGWNPTWLQEQKKINTPPPIVDMRALLPILSKYSNYEDYYKIMEPLLALELWYQISRDFDIADKKITRSSIMSSIVSNSMILTTIPSTNIRYTTLVLEVVVSKRELASPACPVYGDLIFFEYMTNAKGKKAFCTVFAYVEKRREAIITPFTHYNRDLLHYVTEPYAVLSYSVMTKPLDHTNVQTNRIYRLRKISYLRSNMRMIQSLQYLPVSPLSNQILRPEIEAYELPPMQKDKSYSLTTKDNLNAKQLEAVVRVTEAVVRKLPKICLIQGPPGTGKSKVIVNLVTEILYGNGRYGKNKKMRILVCAPSNAAIDEIVLRLLEVRQSQKTSRFKMVRIGRTETMHPLAESISLKVLAQRDVKTTTENYMSPAFTIDSVEEEKRLLTAKINSQRLELESAQSRNAPDTYYLAKTLGESQSRFDLLMNRRPLERIDQKELAKLERGAEAMLLMGADVITCTLSSCYTSLMESSFGESGQEISVCIVDEATQCAEAETLIPLMLGVRTLVLVGDTNQLPATIISQKAKEYGLDQSLFARIQTSFEGKENKPIIQLDTQYRMSWSVAYWPNKYFYAGALKNAANLHNLPFTFYKVINLDSTQDDDKFSNTDEASFVANLFHTLITCPKLEKSHLPVKVGIITPYNNQKQLMKNKIQECIASLPGSIKKRMIYEVNTVDSFQGQERDVIIMSCVRSSGIGFLSDRQRLCVALTRAKHSVILCGNFKTFERDLMWKALLADAISRGVYTRIKASASRDEIKPHVIR